MRCMDARLFHNEQRKGTCTMTPKRALHRTAPLDMP